MTREIKIGLFLGLALLITMIFIFTVGDLSELFREKGYPLYVYFDSAAGLEKRTQVRLAGVKIGRVEDIRLKNNQAEVLILINKGVQIRRDSVATLAALGLLGEKYIEILPGKAPDYCQPGDTIQGLTPVSLDRIGAQLLTVGEELKKAGLLLQELIGSEETKSSLQGSLINIADFTSELKNFWLENKRSLKKTVDQSSRLAGTLSQDMAKITQNLEETVNLLREVISENRGDIRQGLQEVQSLIKKTEEALCQLNQSLQKINKGEGSLGKLIQDERLYDEAATTVHRTRQMVGKFSRVKLRSSFEFQYLGETDKTSGRATLRLGLASRRFLLAQAVRDPWQEKFVFSLQGGVRLGAFSPRVGLIESRFGVGLDYYAWKDRAILRVEAFDFNRQPRPRFRLWSEFWPWRHLYFLLGVEDFTLAPRREVFFGLGVGL